MNNLLRYILLVLCMLSVTTSYNAIAQTANPHQGSGGVANEQKDGHIQISLLTCRPGDELYSMFGHSGIRVCDASRSLDVVYNYGMFNYNANNFAFNFVIGKTDYELGVEKAEGFFQRYDAKDCEVVEQILNLTDEQCRRVVELLEQNYLPENRVYRYNFLYDNCTTRARDLIECAVHSETDSVVYKQTIEPTTFREIIHAYTMGTPWVEFGIDLLLGSEVDKKLTLRESMFAPEYYEHLLDSAVVADKTGHTVALSTDKRLKVSFLGVKEIFATPFTPYKVFWFVFFFGLLFVYIDLQRGKITWIYDVVMLSIQGLVGTVLTFMFLFSAHPAVGSNWLVLIFNPLLFVFMHRMIKKRREGKIDVVTTGYTVWMTLFLLAMPFIPQSFNEALVPFVLILVVRACACEFVVRNGAVKWLRLK